MKKVSSPLSFSLSQASSALADLKITPHSLVTNCLEKINSARHLNNIITLNSPETLNTLAIASLERRKAGKPLSKIDGIPLVVKDNFCTKNLRTSAASKMLENFQPQYERY
jgi:aspartyl-tRNA(Asn)/glutamyl-tRNA(Gln) amidotransferase subunit A